MINTDGFVLYTIREARERLNLCDTTIRTYIRKGKIKATWIGGRMYVADQHIREYLDAVTMAATNTAAAIRATEPKREPATDRYFAIGIYDDDVTVNGIDGDQLQIIPVEITRDEYDEMQRRNFYVYSTERYARQILDALRKDGYDGERVPVFDAILRRADRYRIEKTKREVKAIGAGGMDETGVIDVTVLWDDETGIGLELETDDIVADPERGENPFRTPTGRKTARGIADDLRAYARAKGWNVGHAVAG